MKALRILGLGVAAALISSAALAFQEQQGGATAPAGQAAPAATAGPAAQVAPSAVPAQQAGGTEIRIPGLGTVGVLPKMDWGLELLYGATETKQAVPTPRDPSEDLTIRGSLKHRF